MKSFALFAEFTSPEASTAPNGMPVSGSVGSLVGLKVKLCFTPAPFPPRPQGGSSGETVGDIPPFLRREPTKETSPRSD
jgi:hypothetical protein